MLVSVEVGSNASHPPPSRRRGFVLVSGPAGVRELKPGETVDQSDDAFTWEHLDLVDGDDDGLLQRRDLPEVVLAALLASETRPRCEWIGDGALLNLRGPELHGASESDLLVSIRAWVRSQTVISASRRSLAATSRVMQAMREGLLTDPGDLVAAYAREISTDLDPVIASLSDAVDDCESDLEESHLYQLRRSITKTRSEAIAHRRFVVPNRDALLALAEAQVEWLSDDDRLHVREAADRFARMAEELEAIRERSALLHEQLTDLRAELIDRRSLMIAVVAFIFLPITFITGLLGMNVSGIPFAHAPWAFWGVFGLCAAVGLVVLAWFGMEHWLSR